MTNGKWLTVRQYSKKHGIAEQSVRARVKAETIQHKKIRGVLNVLDETEEPQETTPASTISAQQQLADLQYSLAMKDSKELQNELKRQKLRNLQQDTMIKKMKQTYTKQMYRQQYVEGVFECFTQSFSKLKNALVQLKLPKEKNEKLKRIISKSIKQFQNNLQKYLTEKDKQEIGENEENQTE